MASKTPENVPDLDRAWAAEERVYFVTFPDREKDANGRTRVVKNARVPRPADVSSFRTWALVFVALGAIVGFVLKFVGASSAVFAVGAGFGLFSVVAGVYAWVYAKRLGDRMTAHAKAKVAYEARRAELADEAPRLEAASASKGDGRSHAPAEPINRHARRASAAKKRKA